MANPIEKEEFLVLYQDQLNVIQDLKDKAWKATHYSVLAQAGILALSKVNSCPVSSQTVVLHIVSAFVLVWVLALVSHLQGRVVGRRETLSYLRELRREKGFGRSFEEVWEKIREKKSSASLHERWKDDRPVECAYLTAALLPALVVWIFIWSP